MNTKKLLFQHYVFGYGSLMCPHSRALTAPTLADRCATPVAIHGLQRAFVKRTTRNMTAMGIRFLNNDKNNHCIGVLIPLNATELAQFDQREQGYERVLLDLRQVSKVPFLETAHYDNDTADDYLLGFLNNNNDCNKSLDGMKCNLSDNPARTSTTTATTSPFVWTYVPTIESPPTREHPIVQSYIDTILRGCLTISDDFCREFIETTKGWTTKDAAVDCEDDYDTDETNKENETSNINVSLQDDAPASSLSSSSVWVNDRDAPIYIRGDPAWFRKQANQLDELLQTYRADSFASRRTL
jgi:hypothetical protein